MNDDIKKQIAARTHHLERAKQLAARIQRLRHENFDDGYWLDVAAMNSAIAANPPDVSKDLNDNFIRAIECAGEVTDKLRREEILPPKLLKPLKNPVTGEIVDKLPDSATEQGVLQKNYPEWFDYLTRKEKSPISVIAEHDEKLRRYEQLKAFYERFEPNNNVFRTDNHLEQARLFKSDPERAKLLQAEAMPPAMLPWSARGNYTTLARFIKRFPHLAEVANEAHRIAQEWSDLESKAKEAELRSFIETARKHGLKFETPDEQRRAAARKRMRDVVPMGSLEQERRQKAAALAAIEQKRHAEDVKPEKVF